MRKNILITGGLGYIGSSLAKFLLSTNNFNIYISSRFKTELPKELVGCKLVEINFELDEDINSKVFNDIDVVIHLAALNEIDSLKFPEKAIEVNVLGTQKMLSLAIKNKVKRFVYFSTAHVYGAPLEGNLNELKYPLPTHPYSITHRAAEDYIVAANLENKIEGIVVRLSNAIGPPIHSRIDRWTLLVNDLCRQIAINKSITLRSSGVQVRNFISLLDVCNATFHLLQIKNYDKLFPIYNLGGPSSLSVIEVAKMISQICKTNYGFEPVINAAKIKEEENYLFFDNSKLEKTGFVWENDIHSEIEKTLSIAFSFFANK